MPLSGNVISAVDIHTVPALTILQPVWGTLNPHCTQAQIIQDQGGDSRSPADLDPKGRQIHRQKVNNVEHLFLCANSFLGSKTHYERFFSQRELMPFGIFLATKTESFATKNTVDVICCRKALHFN